MQNEEHSLNSLDLQGSEAQGLGALLCGADEGGACFLQNVCGFMPTVFLVYQYQPFQGLA